VSYKTEFVKFARVNISPGGIIDKEKGIRINGGDIILPHNQA